MKYKSLIGLFLLVTILIQSVIFNSNLALAANYACPEGSTPPGNTWATKADMLNRRQGLAAVTGQNGKIYAIGGWDNYAQQHVNRVEVYDTSDNSWSEKAFMITPREGLGAALGQNGKIYAIGGYNSGQYLKTVEEYDPSSDVWVVKASMPTGRTNLAVVTGSDGKIYAIGGYTNIYPYSNPVESYDPSNNTWSTKASPSIDLQSAFGTLGQNGKIYVTNGYSFAEFDPGAGANGVWTTKANVPTGRNFLTLSAGPDGKIYAMAGYSSPYENALNTVEAYDPSTDTWSAKADMSGYRHSLASTLGLDGKIYAIGGRHLWGANGNSTKLVEAYSPSCEYPLPTTTSISPSTVTAGASAQSLTVTGTGFRNGASVVNYDGSARTTTFNSTTSISISLSASDLANAGTHTVSVTNPTPGGGTSTPNLTFTINNPVPTTTSISPTSKTAGDAAFTLTVNGTNFNSQSVIKWGTTSKTTTLVNSTQLTASITSAEVASAGTVSVTVFNPTPGGGTSGAQTFTINNPVPTTTSISPTSKTAGDAAFTLTVNGTNFNSQSVIKWGATSKTTTLVNSTQLTASITAAEVASAGTVSVTVFNPTPGGGTSGSQTFTINNPAPTTTSISPTSKTAGDAAFTLTVNGTNFNSQSVIKWGSTSKTTTLVNSTQLTASITAAEVASAGTVSVTVFNPTPGGGTSGAQTFTVNNPSPTTTSISPTSKTAGDAAFTLTVNGTNFNSSSTVRYNSADRATTYVSPTQLTASISASDLAIATTVQIKVFNPTPGGGLSSAQTFTVNNPSPTTSSISPTSKTAGDSSFTLTVNGTNFNSSSIVRWNEINRTTTLVSSTQLTASIPSSDLTSAGTANITVFNPTPGGGTSGAQTFTINNPAPTTTSISPTSKTAGDAGFTLTVNGTNFNSQSVIKWGSTSKTTTLVNSTQLTASIPSSDLTSAGTADITVFNPTPGGGTSGAQTFTINNPAPTTTSISPTSILVGTSGPQTLTVTGTALRSGASTVNYDGIARTTTFISETQVSIQLSTSDLSTTGTHTVSVTNPAPGGGTSTPNLIFSVTNPVPTNSSLSPSSMIVGTSGPQTLTVNGTNFNGQSVVNYNGSTRATTLISSTQVSIQLTTSDLSTTGSRNVSVTNPTPGGGTSGDLTFTVVNPVPNTTSISPSSKVVGDPGFTITVNGSNFKPISKVRFDEADRTTTFVSPTRLTATIPATDLLVRGEHFITVFTPTPGGGVSNSQIFTVNLPSISESPAPVIISLSPAFVISGATSQTLNISGNGFLQTSSVLYNGAPKPTIFNSPTSLSVVLSAGDLVLPWNTVSVENSAPCQVSCASNPEVLPVIPAPFLLEDSRVPPGYLVEINGTTSPNNSASRTVKVTIPISASPRTVTLSSSITPTSGLTVAPVPASRGQLYCDIPAGGTTCSIPVLFTATKSDRYIVTFTSNSPQVGTMSYVVSVGGPVGDYKVGDGCGSFDICLPDISAAPASQVNSVSKDVKVKVLSGNPQAIVFDSVQYKVQQGTTTLTVSPFQVIFDQKSSIDPIGGCIVNSTFDATCAILEIRVIQPSVSVGGVIDTTVRDYYTLTFTAISAEGVQKTFTVRVRVI